MAAAADDVGARGQVVQETRFGIAAEVQVAVHFIHLVAVDPKFPVERRRKGAKASQVPQLW